MEVLIPSSEIILECSTRVLLTPTGADAVVNGDAVGGRRPGLHHPADGAEAEGVASSGEHPKQDAAAGRPAVVGVDDGQLVPGGPLQVEVVVVRTGGAAPRDLQRRVGDPPKQEGGGRSWSWGGLFIY